MRLLKLQIREFLSEYISTLRKKRGLTQEQMAEHLHITSRAYGDLERRKYCFSALTLIFLLLMLRGDELAEFWEALRKKVQAFENKEAA